MAHAEVPPFHNPLERIGDTLREIPAWASRHWKSLALTVAALGGAGYVSIQLARPYTPDTQVKTTAPVSDPFKPADPGAGSEVVVPAVPTETPPPATASPSPEPPPTQEPTKVPPTLTAEPTKAAIVEAEKDKPCTIVPEKYCSQGELIYTENYLGQPEIYVGFRIPANEPVFAGKDGQALKAKIGQPSALQGLLATIRDPNLGDPNATAYDVIGDLRFDNMSTVNVKKGDIVGYTQDTGIKNFGDYNLLVTIRRLDPSVGHAVPAEDLLRKLFPEAFAAVKTVDYQGPDKPAPTILSPLFATGK